MRQLHLFRMLWGYFGGGIRVFMLEYTEENYVWKSLGEQGFFLLVSLRDMGILACCTMQLFLKKPQWRKLFCF